MSFWDQLILVCLDFEDTTFLDSFNDFIGKLNVQQVSKVFVDI